MALLSVENVTRRFGGIVALQEVSLDAEAGEIVGLIGPNGAGKTTVFNVITRLYRPQTGDVVFAGSSLLRTRPHRIVRRGIARTFQNVELFRTMSVLDNVLVGTHSHVRGGRKRAVDALEYVGLGPLADRTAGELPFGTQKRIELGDFIRGIRRDFDLTILIVEHHMNLVMGVSDRVHVLSFGRKIAAGAPAEVQRNPHVIEAYLGEPQ